MGVNRAPSQGVLLVNVRRDARDKPLGEPVKAQVTGRIRDLLGNSRPLEFREIKEAGVIDYIAQFPIKSDDVMIFDLKAQAMGGPLISVQMRRALVVTE